MGTIYTARLIERDATPLPLLNCKALTKIIDNQIFIDRLSIELRGKEIVGLIGDRRHSHSMLVGLIAGTTTPNSGRIFFAGQDITDTPSHIREKGGVSSVVNPDELDPRMTVLETVVLGSMVRPRPLFPRQDKISCAEEGKRVLASCGLSALAEKRVSELTAGQRFLLGIAAALAKEPALIVVDASFTGSDADQADILALLRRVREKGAAILIAAHERHFLLGLCDRIVKIPSGRRAIGGSLSRLFKARSKVEKIAGPFS